MPQLSHPPLLSVQILAETPQLLSTPLPLVVGEMLRNICLGDICTDLLNMTAYCDNREPARLKNVTNTLTY